MPYSGQSVVVTHKAKDAVGPISFQARFVNDLCDGNCIVWSTHTHREVTVPMASVKDSGYDLTFKPEGGAP